MAKSRALDRVPELMRLSQEAERAEAAQQLEAARREAVSAAATRREAEKACREQDSAIESSRRGWLALKDDEASGERAKEEADRTALRVSEPENALEHQAASHAQAIRDLTAERYNLRTKVTKIKEGKRRR